jgi:hypothetical protein
MPASLPGARVLTVEIPKTDWEKLEPHLHHGQISQLIRRFVQSLNQKIDEDRFAEIYSWLYSQTELNLD